MSVRNFLPAIGVLLAVATGSASAAAIQGVITLSDSAAIEPQSSTPYFATCDKTAGAAADDGMIHYNFSTSTFPCGGGGIPGFDVEFDLYYGAGAPPGITGVTGALYYITITSLTLTNTSGRTLGPGDTGFAFNPVVALGAGPVQIGYILAGSADDNAGDGAVDVTFKVNAAPDTGGTALDLTASGAVAPFGSLAFSTAVLNPTLFATAASNTLYSSFYFNAPAGDGFTLPGSVDIIVMSPEGTWNPTVVPAPGAGGLAATAIASLGLRRRRRG